MTPTTPAPSTSDWLSGLTIAAVAAYGWVRAAQEGFYGAFGVTVEEVGVQYHTMVGRTLVLVGALGVLVVAVVLLAGLVVGGVWGVDRWFERTLDVGELSRLQLVLCLADIALLLGAGIAVLFRSDTVIAALGGVCLAAGVTIGARVGPAARRAGRGRRVRGVVLAVGAVAYLGGLFACLTAGNRWGHDAQRRGPSSLAASVLIARWPAFGSLPDAPDQVSADVLLLGANEGIAVLYDPTVDGIVRVPADHLVLLPAAPARESAVEGSR